MAVDPKALEELRELNDKGRASMRAAEVHKEFKVSQCQDAILEIRDLLKRFIQLAEGVDDEEFEDLHKTGGGL